MKNEIEIKKIDIDWLKLVNLAFERKDWGKTYTLYNYGDVSVNISMITFDFAHSIAKFKMECIYPHDEFYDSWEVYTYIDFHLNNCSQELFTKIIMRSSVALLEKVINARTKDAAEKEYEDLRYCSWNICDEDITKAGYEEQIKEIEAISNSEIMDLAMDSFKGRVVNKLNEVYETSIESYMICHRESSENMDKLLNLLIELKSKILEDD